MKALKYVKTALLVVLCSGILTTSTIYIEAASAQTATTTKPTVKENFQGNTTSAIDIVNAPNKYLNKQVIIKAKFDKFSTLGLDYKPAFKTSDDYISFLIKRDDTKFDIPLSEMKLFIKRETAEKFIDLKTNDEIEIKGTVFSDALGDAWIEVSQLNIIKKAPEDKNNGEK